MSHPGSQDNALGEMEQSHPSLALQKREWFHIPQARFDRYFCTFETQSELEMQRP